VYASTSAPPSSAFGRALGSRGIGCEEARLSGIDVVVFLPLMASVKARIDRTTDGFLKIVGERGTGRILGGSIVGPHASDLVNIIAPAVHNRMKISDTNGFTFAHRTPSEIFHEMYL
jgi:dihydrolipoamide dehydrogenase